jgi:hypothetical protein
MKIHTLITLVFFVNIVGCVGTAPNAPDAPAAFLRKMPTIEAETLNEKTLQLPRDLPAEKTLVLMAFSQAQQKNVDTWIAGMNLNNANFEWIETPIIDPLYSFFSSFIQNGMRSGIPDLKARARTVTIFTKRAAFLKAMGLPESTDTIYAAVVDRGGNILARVEGDFTSLKAGVLLAAIK